MAFDVVIVGGGSTGAVLATRLSEDPSRKVALIEAGADYPAFADLPPAVAYLGSDRSSGDRSAFDWEFVAKATDSQPAISVPRGKATGGTSAISGSTCLRGLPEDFDQWVAEGLPEWSFEKVMPYYCRLETDLDFGGRSYHGSTGPMRVSRRLEHTWNAEERAFAEACLELGYPLCVDLNEPRVSGVGPTPSSSQDGTRMSTARTYLSLARGRPNLRVYANTFVQRICFDGSRATSVEVAGGKRIEADEVVLSAGTIQSPHLLMLSGIGPADDLRRLGLPVVANVPGVGRSLRDHPTLVLLWERHEGAPVGDASPYPGIRLRFTAPSSPFVNDSRIGLPSNAVSEGHPDGRYGFFVSLNHATSNGDLRLRSADPCVQPLLDYRYFDEPDDERRMREIVTLAMELASRASMSVFTGAPVDPSPEELRDPDALLTWMHRKVRTAHHISSTCAMGSSVDQNAVVDQFGRVWDVDGLRVADASIMPGSVRSNTNLTAIMIGERIADFMTMR
jgi:choline dehydrogenase